MRAYIGENEEARLNALRNLRLLDTPPSESYDRICRLASRLLGAPVSTISLTDSDRQWFKSIVGVSLEQIPRDQAPCTYAIQGEDVFVVPDLLKDERFSTSPLAQAGVRFYAGAPLITRSGYGLGTLAVLDTSPRELPEDERLVLRDLAGMVMTQIDVQNMIGRVDARTGFANEHQLYEDLEDLAARPTGERLAGLMVELLAPRQINHGMRVLGAGFLEELVRTGMEAIRAAIGRQVRLYHVGMTRCLVLLEDADQAAWETLASRLGEVLSAPVLCAGIPITPEPSIGAYDFDAGKTKPRDVLRRLFAASDDARQAGALLSVYDEHLDRAHARSFALVSDVPDALDGQGQLTLVYQPRVALATGRPAGFEALLRWHHPRLGNVPPGEFIPIVEQTAFARRLTEWVLAAALDQAAAWRDAGTPAVMSINASALNLEEPDFALRVQAALARHDLPAKALELEFTETAIARDNARLMRQLNQLREMGIAIAIDDFGAGYSSLSYLRQLPASILKIDRSFVLPLVSSLHDQKLVRATIAMAQDLGYRVVAEGIECGETYEMLRNWGCDEGQGYHIARPQGADQLARWLS